MTKFSSLKSISPHILTSFLGLGLKLSEPYRQVELCQCIVVTFDNQEEYLVCIFPQNFFQKILVCGCPLFLAMPPVMSKLV